MNYEEIINSIKPYVENVKQNNEEAKGLDEQVKQLEIDIKEYEDLGEIGKSEVARANNKKENLVARKNKLENKSINELSTARKIIKETRKEFEIKVEKCTEELGLRESTIQRCKNQMLQLKKDGKTNKYKATNEYVQKVIEEKKEIAKERTEIINNFREIKPKLDNLESLLVLDKIDELESEIENNIAKVDPAKVDPAKVDPAKVDPAKVDPAKVDPAKVDPAKTGDRTIDDIRNRMGEILGVAPFTGIENENEHDIAYQLDDSEIDEIQKLREELKQLSKTEPAKVDPAKVDPAKVDPAKVDPAKVDPAKVDPAKVDPAKVDPAKVDPAKTDPTKADSMDMDLLAKLAKAKKVDNLEDMKKQIIEEAKDNDLKPQEMLEDMAQDEGIIPFQINGITIDGENYILSWGHGNWVNDASTYKIGENGLDLDRKSEAKFKEFILDEFPESKKVINKLDVGIINVLYRNNRKDLCKSYIESVANKEKIEGCIDIEYDLSEAKGLSREETVLRRNARNNKKIATIEGKSRNPFTRVFDFVRERGANLAVRAARQTHPYQWEDDVRQLKEDMKLMLPEGKEEVISKANKILEEQLEEKSYAIRTPEKRLEDRLMGSEEEDLSKPKSITYSPEVQAKFDESKKKMEETGALSWRESMKVAVDNRKIYRDMKKEADTSKNVETPEKSESGKEPSDD